MVSSRIRPPRSAVIAAVVLVIAAFGLYRLARSRTFQLFGRLVARVETAERAVALTFDDGPNPARVDEILRALREADVRATFFVTGHDMDTDRDAGRRLVAAGHELGNHTYTHARMVLRSAAFVRDEIERTDTAIRDAGERHAIPFRPPYGWKLFRLPLYLRCTGRTTVTWDLEPDSYADVRATPEGIAVYVHANVRPGSIVLLHVWWSGNETSRAAIPLVARRLRADGYPLVTISELLATVR